MFVIDFDAVRVKVFQLNFSCIKVHDAYRQAIDIRLRTYKM